MTTIDLCPGCGYPKFGPGLCDYCLPLQAIGQGSLRSSQTRPMNVQIVDPPPAGKAS